MSNYKIITHPGSAHNDDIIACALLLAKWPSMPIYRREVTDTDLYDDFTTFVVDTGKKYEHGFKNYDHHQDENLPCAAHLIAQHYYPEFDFAGAFPWWENMNLQDTKGFPALARKYNLKPAELQELQNTLGFLLKAEFSEATEILPDTRLHENLHQLGRLLTVHAFEFSQDYKACEKTNFANVMTCLTEKPGNRARFKFARDNGCDIVIAPSERNEGRLTVTRVDDARGIDFRKCKNMKGVHFVHANGFMCEADVDISLDKLIYTATK